MTKKPPISKNIGNKLCRFRKYVMPIAHIPMVNAKKIILHSSQGLDKKPNPTKGRLVINNGTIAQWIAHSTDAVIPMLSSFGLPFVVFTLAKIGTNAIMLRFKTVILKSAYERWQKFFHNLLVLLLLPTKNYKLCLCNVIHR